MRSHFARNCQHFAISGTKSNRGLDQVSRYLMHALNLINALNLLSRLCLLQWDLLMERSTVQWIRSSNEANQHQSDCLLASAWGWAWQELNGSSVKPVMILPWRKTYTRWTSPEFKKQHYSKHGSSLNFSFSLHFSSASPHPDINVPISACTKTQELSLEHSSLKHSSFSPENGRADSVPEGSVWGNPLLGSATTRPSRAVRKITWPGSIIPGTSLLFCGSLTFNTSPWWPNIIQCDNFRELIESRLPQFNWLELIFSKTASSQTKSEPKDKWKKWVFKAFLKNIYKKVWYQCGHKYPYEEGVP